MGDIKGEKQLMIVNKKAKFDQDILAMGKKKFNIIWSNFGNIQWRLTCNGLNQECDNNFQRKLFFKSTTLHDF